MIPDVADTHAIFPPRAVFEDDGKYIGHESSNPHGKPQPLVSGVEFPGKGGMLLHFEDKKYPKKGWPFKQAILAIDAIKRSIISCVRFCISKPMRYFLPLFFLIPNFLKRRIIQEAIHQFTFFSDRVFIGWGVYLKPSFYSTMVREIHRVGTELSETEDDKLLVKAICMILEFDDAYRFRLQDLLGEMDLVEFFKNPTKESRRLLKLAVVRGQGTEEKFDSFSKVIPYLFYIKSFRDTIFSFFKKVDMEQLYLDENDWYECLTWVGWDFGGRTMYQRLLLKEHVDDEWYKAGKKHFDSEGNEIKLDKLQQA